MELLVDFKIKKTKNYLISHSKIYHFWVFQQQVIKIEDPKFNRLSTREYGKCKYFDIRRNFLRLFVLEVSIILFESRQRDSQTDRKK